MSMSEILSIKNTLILEDIQSTSFFLAKKRYKYKTLVSQLFPELANYFELRHITRGYSKYSGCTKS